MSNKGLAQGPANARNTEASCSNRIRAPAETIRAGTSVTTTSRPLWRSVARNVSPCGRFLSNPGRTIALAEQRAEMRAGRRRLAGLVHGSAFDGLCHGSTVPGKIR